MAARLGMEEKAFAYFKNIIRVDLDDTLNNTVDGIHTANMAGSYMAVIYGFGGFRLKESGIFLAPLLPGDWSAYSFKISFEGSRIMVHVKESECKFVLEQGGAKDIHVYGDKYLLEDVLIVKRPK
jgi:Trehalose and maltose hydrolases (possible phosphorylases)